MLKIKYLEAELVWDEDDWEWKPVEKGLLGEGVAEGVNAVTPDSYPNTGPESRSLPPESPRYLYRGFLEEIGEALEGIEVLDLPVVEGALPVDVVV